MIHNINDMNDNKEINGNAIYTSSSIKFINRFGCINVKLQIHNNILDNNFKNINEKKSIKSFITKLNMNITKLSEVFKNKDKIYRHLIQRHEDNEINIITLSKYIQYLGLLLLYNDPFGDITYIRKLYMYSNELQTKEMNIMYGNNIKNNKFINYDDLINIRDKYKDSFNDGNILFEQHMIYLKLSLNTYIPPLRLDLNDMRIIYDVIPFVDINDKQNYIYKYNDVYYIVINNDKISTRKGGIILPLNITNDYMDSNTITQIINKSLEIYPRDYIFSSRWHSNKKIHTLTYSNMLKYNDVIITQNNLRKSYITNYHNKLTNNKLYEISKRMRHDLNTARSIYNLI